MRARAMVWLALAAGCGSGPSVTQACNDFAQARCTRLTNCTSGANITRAYGDLQTCLAREALGCSITLGAPDSGTTTVGVELCVGAIARESCADLLGDNPPPECVNKGTRGLDARCAFGSQCASTYCINGKTSACGICGEAPPAGISCTNTICARLQICTPRTATCQKVAQLGDTCDNTTRLCGADLVCPLPMGMTEATCVSSIGTLGADCGGTLGSCDGTKGLVCVNKKCAAISYVGDGMPCGTLAPNTPGVGCLAGGQCYTSTGVAQLGEAGICKSAAADGKPCDTILGPPCLTPARCMLTSGGSTGVCTVPSAASCG